MQPILKTKIIPPSRRSDLLTRRRLIELFSELLGYKLVLLVAPAGYGKTSLLVDLTSTLDKPVCWYSLDSLDKDSHRFITYFIAAISQRFPKFGKESMAMLQNLLSAQATMDQFLTVVINELIETIDQDFVLVVDDYHLVEQSTEIGEFLSKFVQSTSERCHLVLASRRLISLPDLPLMVARQQVAGLDHEELAFRGDEVETWALQNYAVSLTDGQISELVRATEGWITGLLLSTQFKHREEGSRKRIHRVAGVGLYDYLAEQVLDAQTQEMRDFLLRTSVLEEFNAQLCADVLGDQLLPAGRTWQGLLDQVMGSDLFALPVGEDGSWLRYHRLFQEFLSYRLAQDRPREEAEILRRFAAVCVQREDWERAYGLYQQLGDLEQIAALIETAGMRLFRIGRIRLLQDWLANLTDDQLAARPGLLILHGIVLSERGHVEEGLARLQLALAALGEDGAAHDRALAQAHVSVIHRFLGDYEAALDSAHEAIALLTANGAPETSEAYALALKNLGSTHCLMGRLGEGIELLEQSLACYRTAEDVQNIATVMGDIALAHFMAGHLDQAQTLYEETRATWLDLRNPLKLSWLLNNLGVLYHQQGNYEHAIRVLLEALGYCQRSGSTFNEMLTFASIGDLFMDLEVWNAAESAYGEAYAIAQLRQDRFYTFYLELNRARLAWSNGFDSQVFDYLDAAGSLVLDKNAPYEWGLFRLFMGRYFLISENAEQAVTPLEDAVERLANTGQVSENVTANLLLAMARNESGHRKDADDALSRALDFADRLESIQPFATVARRHGALFGRLMRGRASDPRVKRLRDGVTALDVAIPQARRRVRRLLTEPWNVVFPVPPQIILHAFGRPEVIINGRLLSKGDWTTLISRDLLFCLLAHPEGLSREQIADLFWPDATIDQVKSRFKNAIYRLRNAMGVNMVEFVDDIYRINGQIDYEYDVESFLAYLEEADAADHRTGRKNALEAAIALYRGPYLLDVDESWFWVERERLRRYWAEAIMELANMAFQDQEYELALERCQELLIDDPCNEEVHRLAMRIHAASGNRAGVARQFQECSDALRSEIDAPPSVQTEELYSQLMDR